MPDKLPIKKGVFPPSGHYTYQPPQLLMGMDLSKKPDQTVAFIFNLPLTKAEALAYSATSAGVATPHHREILQAWLVKMTLVHGSWVTEEITLD